MNITAVLLSSALLLNDFVLEITFCSLHINQISLAGLLEMWKALPRN